MIDKVKNLLARRIELENELAAHETTFDPARMEKLGREYTSLNKNLPIYKEYVDTVEKLAQARDIIATESDAELLELAHEEIRRLETLLPALEEKIKYLLVPRDPIDVKNAIVEIRAGTGGIEAGIFAADLFRMYTHYTEARGWKYEVMDSSYGDIGAIKEIVFLVNGDGAYGTLKYESGVHRVQRVPQTEAQGRIHTSAASVAVFPEATDLEVQLDPQDLRIDVYRSGGAGGQHVNKTESAVRVVHIPTGLVVICQDEKSQHKNKARALKVLQSRLYDLKLSEQKAQEDASRRSMVGTGDRSAKIRTYNFPQSRVTDHRINFTVYDLENFINGQIQKLIDALYVADINKRLENVAGEE